MVDPIDEANGPSRRGALAFFARLPLGSLLQCSS
jgi:hypothetical protein